MQRNIRKLMMLLKVRRKLEKREKERVKSRLGAVVKVIKLKQPNMSKIMRSLVAFKSNQHQQKRWRKQTSSEM